MPCHSPLQGWAAKEKTKNGKRKTVFNLKYGLIDRVREVPCGQCSGCRLERSRQWATRCVHQASENDENCFLTLTYNDEHLPADESLDIDHHKKFVKRLRKHLAPKKIKFFHGGEYGDQLGRPHYHYLIFGWDPIDKELISQEDGIKLYTSAIIEKIWGKGFITVGDVTFESAAYVARYCMKKVTGDMSKDHYRKLNPHTGVWHSIRPEYGCQSKGIGFEWFTRYKTDVFPHDYVVIRGKKSTPPKYYTKILEEKDNDTYKKVRKERLKNAKKNKKDNTSRRLRAKEICLDKKIEILNRKLK